MKVWKKILAVCCMAAVLAAMPGMQALANDVQTESDSIASTEEVAPVDEELVGNVDRYVGGNFKASYDSGPNTPTYIPSTCFSKYILISLSDILEALLSLVTAIS